MICVSIPKGAAVLDCLDDQVPFALHGAPEARVAALALLAGGCACFEVPWEWVCFESFEACGWAIHAWPLGADSANVLRVEIECSGQFIASHPDVEALEGEAVEISSRPELKAWLSAEWVRLYGQLGGLEVAEAGLLASQLIDEGR